MGSSSEKPSDVVTLKGMRFHARIGVLPHEAEIAQSIEVDASLWVRRTSAKLTAKDIVDYRRQDVVAEVRKIVPHGVDAIVEVSAAHNAEADAQVIGMHGAVAIYADDGGQSVTIPIRPMMGPNARWQ